MPYFPFNTNVPNAPDNASDDQPDMKINNNSSDRILSVDHYSFNGDALNNPGGYHKQMTLLNVETPNSVPIAGESAYLLAISKNSNSWPAWFNELKDSGNSAITFMTGRSLPKENGYEYLPGGLLIQWGVTKKLSRTNPFFGDNFSIPFLSTPFFVKTQGYASGALTTSILKILVTSKNKTGFKASVNFTNLDNLTRIYWFAIGLANA